MSSDEEKKFKLDELPDEGSSSFFTPPPRKKRPSEMEPRLATLKEAPPAQKVEVMLQRWTFDEPVRNYNWVFYVALLGILEFTPAYQMYLNELDLMNHGFFDVGGDIVRSFTLYLEGIIRHPAVLILLTPLFFSFSRPSDYRFDITFDGVSTVKRYLPKGSKEMISPVFIKWAEIQEVKKLTVQGKEILSLYSLEGHIADIIWYIDSDKKKAIKLLLQGMVVSKHPLRLFLEKDLK